MTRRALDRDYAVVEFQVGMSGTVVAIKLTLATEEGMGDGSRERTTIRLTPQMARALSGDLNEAAEAVALGKVHPRTRQ